MYIKRIISVVLLLVFLAGSFSRLWVVADYYAFTEKYAKNCVNKARPALHCNGKCQMTKKMKAEETREQKNQESKSETGHFNLFFSSLSSTFYFNTNQALSLKNVPFASGKYSLNAEHGIFHPPRA